ncbi:hypothetical protein BT96DRAFT_995130 [Gymnopus androsaceus JB14]|uniref:F-box domain-containing protein n=1 Tax=Gymnopus androsaceus JB14 TaxID=1447944 RepID=A0A6A4HHT9_9AGAR|nr:hypothetical protein BT96DRAFT_995130 [Gymnopus androsaceus JB14]
MFTPDLPAETSSEILDFCNPIGVSAMAATSTSNRQFIRSYYVIRLSIHLAYYIDNPNTFLTTLDSTESLIIGPFILSFLNMTLNSNCALLIVAPQKSLAMWSDYADIECWSLESAVFPVPSKTTAPFTSLIVH